MSFKFSKALGAWFCCLLSFVLGMSLRVQAVEKGPLKVVPYVDLERYMGTWYEIARMPASFQRFCTNSQAQYTLLEDSQVRVRNSCHFGWPSGPVVSIRGKARVVEGEASNAKLKVRFWPIGREGDYWILELDTEHYAWAVVGEPLRKNGWILSRTEDLDEKLYLDLVQRMQTKHGYDVSKLVRD